MATLPVCISGQRKLRMVVLGSSRVGKTQLVSRFMGKPFSEAYIPTVEDFHTKMYAIRGHTYQLDILDTSGAMVNPLTQQLTLMTGDVYLIVYSITEQSSFEYAKELAKKVEEAKDALCNSAFPKEGERKKKSINSHTPIFIAGNKADLENQRVVSRSAAADWLNDNQKSSRYLRGHVDVSARESSSVQALFEQLFLTAHLPLEMSPNMHRKVSTDTFMETTSSLAAQHKSSSPSFFRSQSTDSNKHIKSGKVWHSFKSVRSVKHAASSSPGSTSSGSAVSIASEEMTFDPVEDNGQKPSSPKSDLLNPNDAFATVCFNQRRPSATTEVNLAFSKVTSNYDCVRKCSKRGKTRCDTSSEYVERREKSEAGKDQARGWTSPLQRFKKFIHA